MPELKGSDFNGVFTIKQMNNNSGYLSLKMKKSLIHIIKRQYINNFNLN